MAIVTATNVFDFCGSPSDVRATQSTAVTNLIDSVQSHIESVTGRSIEVFSFSSIPLVDGHNCSINFESIFLSGKLYDTYALDSVTCDGVLLTSGVHYLLSRGELIRMDLFSWTKKPGAVVISGQSRMGGEAGIEDIKQILIEIVAIKLGLWKKTILTEGGRVEVEQSLKPRYDALKLYTRRPI